MASRRQTIAPTPYSITWSSSASRIRLVTRTVLVPSARVSRLSRDSVGSSSASASRTATVPGRPVPSSISSTSECRRSWLTAPSRDSGSDAWTSTGILTGAR